MLSLYLPGNTWVHRTSVWLKLVAVLGLALSVSLRQPSWLTLGLFATLICTAFVSSVGFKQLLEQLYRLRVVLLIVLLPQLIFRDLATAGHNTLRIFLVVLAASLMTLTTRTTVLLEALTRLMKPLRVVGVDPEKPALLLLLTMTTIPAIGSLRNQLQSTYRARGAGFFSATAITGLLVLTMKHADELAEALQSRGLDL